MTHHFLHLFFSLECWQMSRCLSVHFVHVYMHFPWRHICTEDLSIIDVNKSIIKLLVLTTAKCNITHTWLFNTIYATILQFLVISAKLSWIWAIFASRFYSTMLTRYTFKIWHMTYSLTFIIANQRQNIDLPKSTSIALFTAFSSYFMNTKNSTTRYLRIQSIGTTIHNS